MKIFAKLLLIVIATMAIWPSQTLAQGSNALFLYLDTASDLTRGIGGIDKVVEALLSQRRGGYLKSKDNEVAECDVNFQRFGPVVPAGITNIETAKLIPAPEPLTGVPGAVSYDTSIDPTALFTLGNAPNGAEIFSIPTHEVGNMLYMNREICLQLKAIRRVQYDMEEKQLVEDVATRKGAAKAISDHEAQFAENLQKGRKVSPGLTGTAGAGEGQPNYVLNLGNEVRDARKEAFHVYMDELKNSQNIHKDIIPSDLKTYRDKGIDSTITKAEYDKYINDDPSISNTDWWAYFLKVSHPENNPEGSYLLALKEAQMKEKDAEQNIRDENIANKGYLDSRECVGGMTEDGFCKEWETKTPGSSLGSYMDNLTFSAVRQAESADSVQEDFIKRDLSFSYNKVFSLSDHLDLRNNLSIFTKVNPCLEALGLNLDVGRAAPIGLSLDVDLSLAAVLPALNIPFLNEIGFLLNLPNVYLSLTGTAEAALGCLTSFLPE